jgi:hypothetical protein
MEPLFPFFRIVVEVKPGIGSTAFIVNPALPFIRKDQRIMLGGGPQPAVSRNIVPTGGVGGAHFDIGFLHLLFKLGDLSGHLITIISQRIETVHRSTEFSFQSSDFEVLGQSLFLDPSDFLTGPVAIVMALFLLSSRFINLTGYGN